MYQRIVQWLAGPIAILAGWLATQLVQSVHIFGGLGITGNQIAHAIVVSTTFIASAAVTYAAHHKWLDNLAKWWAQNEGPTVAVGAEVEIPDLEPVDIGGHDVQTVPPDTTTKPDAGS